MSLTMSQGEGLTVITIASDPKSKCPVLCQVLSFLCCSPVCSVSQSMKKQLTNIHTALGTMQIIVGVINIVFGILLKIPEMWTYVTDSVFWIGGVVLVIGIVTVLAAKFPSPVLLVITVILNIVSAALAITAVVLCSVDLATGNQQHCGSSFYSSYDDAATPSPEQMRRTEICMQYKYLNKMILGGLDIMMIVLSVLQLCVTISFCVLTGKALRKKDEDVKLVEDPELHKPLLEDVTAGAAC
uniref:Transmembrane protein 176l.1 n=1 Tax=Cyprinus carpio TaxID=7962 RepID=A0A8C2JJ55_CYPCA